MNLTDLQKMGITYNWETICIGIIDDYFTPQVIVAYSEELMSQGIDDAIVTEFAWGVDERDLQEVLFKLKDHFSLNFDEDTKEYKLEKQKLRFVYLSQMDSETSSEEELLDKITAFYDNNGYPEDMASFVNYMPEEKNETSKEIIERFHTFLKSEEKKAYHEKKK